MDFTVYLYDNGIEMEFDDFSVILEKGEAIFSDENIQKEKELVFIGKIRIYYDKKKKLFFTFRFKEKRLNLYTFKNRLETLENIGPRYIIYCLFAEMGTKGFEVALYVPQEFTTSLLEIDDNEST